jgi:hypothetical protein
MAIKDEREKKDRWRQTKNSLATHAVQEWKGRRDNLHVTLEATVWLPNAATCIAHIAPK